MSKRDLERKRKEEQEATAHVFKDFIDTFQNVSACAPNKTFVRSEILYADGQNCNQMGQIYNPKPLIKQSKAKEVNTAIEYAKLLKDAPLDKVSKKFEKPKSNLDLLKEEIKQRHLERGEKDRIKDELELPALSYFDGGDPNSTNLFITNLSPKITENNLMVEFGMYGPLASVKIMWPRGDDKSFRGSHCGFVAFMSRKDAERALLANKHRDDMRVGWGKSVEIPTHPIYIPNDLLKLYLPPLQTGLPFNAQPPENYQGKEIEDEHFLEKCSVKVTVPLNKKQLMLIHRMVEFVVREGPMFEAFIMNQEIRNSDYSFLFDYQSPLHIYYRWKVFSILNGDHQKSWRLEPFRMFKGGSIWLPPVAPDYTKGMPEELIKNTNNQGGQLSENQCARLIGLIRELTLNRTSVAEAMVFCVNHSGAIDDALEIILESLTNPDTRPVKKIARMYLFSDVVTNCRIRKVKLKLDDNLNELEAVFDSMQDCYLKLSCAHDRDNFRNSDYSFLFDYQSPLHIYYRWKVFSILNGDHQKSWRLEPFRMFKGGSIWLPPVAPDYTKGMPEELIRNTNVQGGQLSENQCARLIGLIRELTLNRTSVAEAMVFCVNHSGAIDDALEIILESLTNPDTRPVQKIARMYLFSDVVTNCRIRKVKLKMDDNLKELEAVFDSMQDCYLKLSCAHDRDNFRNSDYSFLFDYQSPLHIYYRWKVFSILNGDHQKSWRLEPFRMFKGGSIWLPPVAPDYTKGMPEELIKNTNVQGGQLSENQCARLIGLIRELTLNRTSVAEAMVFCVNHSGAIDDALEIILESLTNPDTSTVKKIARMYLFSDVVTNCRIRKVKLKLDDDLKELEAVFDSMQDCYLKLSCAHDRDNFRNSDYSFLFDYQSPLHIYYRWKVFSILNGDHQKSWRLEPFRMFKGGSIWLPPVAPDYTKGMPEELIRNTNVQGGQLSENQCARLIGLIRELTLNRTSVAEAMVFCVNHSGAIDDALEIILESLTNPDTRPVKKIARMYLFSDVVTNCRIRKVKLKLDDNLKELETVFDSMQDCYLKLSCAHDRDNFRNSDYSFLFDYQSPLHIYYRWKVFSNLNGDHQKSWRLEPFRMFKGGSIWLPPVAPDYTKEMSEELIKNTNVQGGQLSENQCARLTGLIRELTLNRTSVAEAMVFCVNHSGAIDDALEIILESLTNPDTRPVQKIARMYLFSDVVTNCRIRKVKLKLDDNLKELETVFDSMQDCYLKLSCAHDRDNFRYRIQRVITYWTMYNVFPRHALQKVDDYFTDTPVQIQEEDNSSSDEPLDGASLLKRSMKHNDIGPEVQVAPAQVKPRLKKSIDLEYFVPSKWDTVDPEEVEAQAMSTEKLYYMEAENQLKETKKKHKRRSKSKKLHR